MIGLNPCFNGRYSQSFAAFKKLVKENVLILVLMEDTLRVTVFNWDVSELNVLILVLMEDTLRGNCHNGRNT